MIDGLGFHNLLNSSERAPFLAANLTDAPELFSGFPSSTVASITSLATGLPPAQHGLFAYRIYDRALERDCNLLSGMDRYSILDYLRVEPLSSSHPITAVTKPEYVDSGFSRATMTGATKTASAIAERIELAIGSANEPGAITYLYIPELDQTAHANGVGSETWLSLLEEIDQQIRHLVRNLPSDVGVLVLADHGIVDVTTDHHIYLDETLQAEELLAVGGDPRSTFIYLKDPNQQMQVSARLSAWLGDRAKVMDLAEMFEAGLFGTDLREDPELLPDFVVLAADGYACYHRNFAKPASLRMIGQHGGLSQTECALPLIRLGGYSSSDSDLVP